MKKNIYEELFRKNKNKRVEYGNTKNSFEYFKRFKISKNAKILDIGTNIGSLPNLIYTGGWKKVYGADIAPSAVKYGKKKYPEISKNLKLIKTKKLPFKDNSFDVVTSFDVIEHIPKPEELISEVYRILKKEGIFIFQTPNKPFNSVWETLASKSFSKWKEFHCSLQTVGSLDRLLENTGFRDIVIEKFSVATEYNKQKVKRKLGIVFIPFLYIVDKFPLTIFPNLWGSCEK